MHRYDDEGRTDGLKRLIAGHDIPKWQVRRGKTGGLVSETTVIGEDAWVDTQSTVRDSILSGTLVRNSEIFESQVKHGVIQSSTVYKSVLDESACNGAKISNSILYGSILTVKRSLTLSRWTQAYLWTQAYVGRFAAEMIAEMLDSERMDAIGGSKIEASTLSTAVISRDSSVSFSNISHTEVHGSVVDSSTLTGSEVAYATVSDSSVERSYLSHCVVRAARVSRLSRDAEFGKLRFPSTIGLAHNIELSGGYFGDFPAQIDIWPKLPGRIRQIAFLSWIVGVPWAFWTTPLLSVIIAMPLPALVGLRLASGLASNIVGKLEARSIAKKTPGKVRSSVVTALKSCGAAVASLKKLLNGLLLAGTVLVPTAIVSGAVVERVLNSDGEPSRSTEAVDSVRFETGSDTDQFDRGASSSTASSEVSVPTPLPVTSSNLRAVAYDREHSHLYVWFHSGDLYRYYNVSESVYRSLLAASSKGRYHASYIRDQYTSVRIG